MTRAGEYRHLVTIRAPAGVLHESETVDVATDVHARIIPLELPFQEREHLGLGGLLTAVTYAVHVRYRTDIKPAYVLVEGACCEMPRTFQVVTIVPTDRRDELKLTCVTEG
jgi:head-tail adaptor